MQCTVLCPIALQSRNAMSFVEKLNGATMFRTPKILFLTEKDSMETREH